MKNLKKVKAFTASILVSAMVMSMATGFTAIAAESDTTFVIGVTGNEENHHYEAYQIFKATMKEASDEEEKFMIDGWGDGVDPDALIEGLEESALLKEEFAEAVKETDPVECARKVARTLEKYDQDGKELQEFAKIAAKALTETAIVAEDNEYNQIDVKACGYYLIKDSDESKALAKTRYILAATTELNPTAKADAPSIDKKIKENNELVEFNTASIGDTITYQLNSKVPDTTGYNKYFYIVNDKMDKGLTFDETSVEVKIGKESLLNEAPNTDDELTDKEFYVETSTNKDGKTEFKIVVKNFVQYTKDADIVITYNAILNEDAEIGTKGNYNAVDLVFSNNPNYEYKGIPEDPEDPDDPGKPDEPNPGKPSEPGEPDDPDKEPTGETPWVKVVTYTTGIELTKVDVRDTNKRLNGAEFTIEGEGVNKVVKVYNEYEADEEGTYYKLKNGTFTAEAPTDETNAKYDGTEKYRQVTKSDVVDSEGNTELTGLAVDTDGVLRINGLNAGIYTITETKAPEGYVTKTSPMTITISAEDITLDSCTWKYDTSGVIEDITNKDGILTFKVTNRKGVSLPGTGAFGSKIFYALGTLFTGAGAAYMISKRKSKKEEE